VAFTGSIDNERFFMLNDSQWSDERRQFVGLQKKRGISRAAGEAAGDDVQVRSSERLVDEDAVGTEQIDEEREQRPVEEAHAHDRIETLGAKRQCSRVGYNAQHARVARDRSGDGVLNEFDDDHGPALLREGLRMTPGTAGNVRDQCFDGQRQAPSDNPRRRRTIRLGAPLSVPRFPVGSVPAFLPFGHR